MGPEEDSLWIEIDAVMTRPTRGEQEARLTDPAALANIIGYPPLISQAGESHGAIEPFRVAGVTIRRPFHGPAGHDDLPAAGTDPATPPEPPPVIGQVVG